MVCSWTSRVHEVRGCAERVRVDVRVCISSNTYSRISLCSTDPDIKKLLKTFSQETWKSMHLSKLVAYNIVMVGACDPCAL